MLLSNWVKIALLIMQVVLISEDHIRGSAMKVSEVVGFRM